MAEGVIGSIILRIGGILTNEAIKLAASKRELMKDMREIKDELESMQSFLRAAERLRGADESIANYIKQTRSVAFDIEDIIDEFTYKIGEEQGGILSSTIDRIRNIGSWKDLSKRLREIKVSLQNIAERKARHNIGALEIKPSPSKTSGRSHSPAEYAHFFKEDDLVGIDENRDILLRWLKDEQQQNMIISVWGMGGMGKTTLVTHAYNIIKTTFDVYAWVSVSQDYNSEDLLRQIIKKFCREDQNKIATSENTDGMGYTRLVETIRGILQNKRCIIILDDVWRTDAWSEIQQAFSDGNSNNKIVLTTRTYDVAQLAHEHCRLELKPLTADHSWNLFCKNAFWKNTDRICPPLLKRWAEKFLEKCSGLPLAIVSIGSLLSFKEQLNTEWEKVYKDLEWYLTNNKSKLHEKVHDILKLSLDDLPHCLRNCFLYCSSFPEDYKIESDRLIRLWVAEGFIYIEGRERTMEEVAEDYLSELVHRCLLQVAGRNDVGRVDAYRMHDIIRVLALSESKELSICMNYEQSEGYKARRLSILGSITEYCIDDKFHLRSVLAFNDSMSHDLLKSVLRSSNLLRVLELQGAPIKKLPSEICNLFNLRYLGLRETKIKELPRSIGKLQNLQTLDIFQTKIEKLPKGITELQKLRYLFMSGRDFERIEAPMGIRRLKGLQTLNYIKATTEIVQNVGAFTELRTFHIKDVRTHHCADLWNGITKMSHLEDLSIESEYRQELQQLGTLCLPLPIQTLILEGKLDKKSLPELATSFGSLTNLTSLTLYSAKLDEDTFTYLQALLALMSLVLSTTAYDGMKLHFQATSFPKLKKLDIFDAPKLSQIEIERGAMPSLTNLSLMDCPELKELPHDIEYLTTLEDLYIHSPAEELFELLLGEGEGEGEGEGDQRNEYRTRVRHIPNFTIGFFNRDGKYVTKRIQ